MTNMDPVMEPIFTKTIPCPRVGILKMIPCSAVRPRTEKYEYLPRDVGDVFACHFMGKEGGYEDLLLDFAGGSILASWN